MRRLLVLAFLVAGFGVGCGSSDDEDGGLGPAGAGCPSDGTSYDSEWQALECGVLTLVNQHRAAGATCGGDAMPSVPALAMNAQLRTAARGHAADMSSRNYFDHDSQDGRDPGDRISATGYSFSTWGENIAAGNGTADAVMDQWMNSPGHCRNIMSGSFKEIGVGYSLTDSSQYRHYWVQNFGAQR